MMPNQNQSQFMNQQSQGRPQYKNFNDFSNMNNNINNINNINSQFNQFARPKNYVNYNNFDNLNMNTNDIIFRNIYDELRRKMVTIHDIENKEQAGDFIYEFEESLYKEEAGKITEMILEYDLTKIINMIINEPMKLKEKIGNNITLFKLIKNK